jgi:hypothetical protein
MALWQTTLAGSGTLSSSQSLNYGHLPLADGTQSALTVFAWLNIGGYAGNNAFAVSNRDSTHTKGWGALNLTTGDGGSNLNLEFDDVGYTGTNDGNFAWNGPAVNTWHNHCVVKDRSSGANVPKYYLDGIDQGAPVGSVAPSGSPVSSDTTPLVIGNDAGVGGSGNFQGGIAHVAIWNVLLNPVEVALLGIGWPPSLIRPDALVFYVPFEPGDTAAGALDRGRSQAGLPTVAGAWTAAPGPPMVAQPQALLREWLERGVATSAGGSSLTIDLMGELEFLAGRRSEAFCPVQLLAALQHERLAPAEFTSGQRGDAPAPAASLAAARGDGGLPWEAGATAKFAPALLAEWAGAVQVSADAAAPLEWRVTLGADSTAFTESPIGVDADAPWNGEALAGALREALVPATLSALLAADGAAAVEWRALNIVAADGAVAVQWQARVTAEGLPVLEFGGSAVRRILLRGDRLAAALMAGESLRAATLTRETLTTATFTTESLS